MRLLRNWNDSITYQISLVNKAAADIPAGKIWDDTEQAIGTTTRSSLMTPATTRSTSRPKAGGGPHRKSAGSHGAGAKPGAAPGKDRAVTRVR